MDSGLVLNFLPESAVAELGRVTAAYVWDYGDKMELLRYFWDAAVAIDSAAAVYDEGQRLGGGWNPDGAFLTNEFMNWC